MFFIFIFTCLQTNFHYICTNFTDRKIRKKIMLNPINKTIELADGRTITIETGKLAKQADGAVTVRMNNTVLLATVCAAKDATPGVDFMPLQVEYKEKFSAFGRFPGGFTKREGKASDYEILTSRLVDRALRPLFPDNYHAEVYVNVILFSADGEDMPDALAGLASAALAVSDIPFNGPISECRVARIDGKYVVNPTFSELEKADIDIMVGATLDNIMMVEGEMDEVQESEMLEAIKVAHEAIKVQCQAQLELSEACGKLVKREYCHEVNDDELRKDVHEKCYAKAYAVATSGTDKHQRAEAFEAVVEEYKAQFSEEELTDEKVEMIGRYYHDVEKEAMRRAILDEGKRLDGRKTTEIRPIWIETDCLPGPHGSAIFTRGETQSLSTVTLGTKADEKMIDDVLNHEKERFLLHYNFPPFSTGEAKASRGVGRREIGHGALAERALIPVLPTPEEFPYAIRAVSETFESNGSTSMASTCASCMSLMAAGVPIKKMVAGISCGLVTGETDDDYIVLTDIQGLEDFFGDMDFKVAGTHDGITAIQMDIKIHGLTRPIVEEAIARTKEAREYIINEIMTPCIAHPRAEVGKYAPKIISIKIDPEKIGDVVGQRGKTINEIIARTGVKIDITDDGSVSVCGTDKEMMDKAIEMIKIITTEFQAGQIFKGKVVSIKEFGAFVEFAPGKEGMVHISKIAKERIDRVEDVLTLGDQVTVVCLGKDKMGRMSFSMKDVAQV